MLRDLVGLQQILHHPRSIQFLHFSLLFNCYEFQQKTKNRGGRRAVNPKHGGPELSPLTLNFAGKLSGAIHDIIKASRSVATVVNMGFSINRLTPSNALTCRQYRWYDCILYFPHNYALKIQILSILVVRPMWLKRSPFNSQSRGSLGVRGERSTRRVGVTFIRC